MAGGLPRIWIVTNPAHPDGPVRPVIEALRGCAPGVVGVQLRAKESTDRELIRWGRELREATRQSDSPLTVNRRADVAQIVGADGVHLPERGLDPARIHLQWPEFSLVGVSRHDRTGLQRANAEGATYAFLSPVFPVPGKGEPLGIEGFGSAIADVGIPTYALGGIQSEHVGPLLSAGAAGFAVRRAIYDARDRQAALQALVDALDKSRRSGE